MKNSWIAGALNIIPGLGYVYTGTRTLFAVLLLSIWPLIFIAGIMTPMEELEMMETTEAVPFRVTDALPFLAFITAFVVDAYQEAKRVNGGAKKKSETISQRR